MKVKHSSAALIVALIPIIVVVLMWIGVKLSEKNVVTEIRLPILAIIGVISLLVTLTLATIAYAMLDLSDKTQALGLPTGSVRAVIALALVVIFAIMTVYLYSTLSSGGEIKQLRGVSTNELNSLRHDAARPGSRIVIYQEFQGPSKTWNVMYQIRTSQDASDFANQLLAILGTLVTAVSSFYFGSRSVEAAQATVATRAANITLPTVTSVKPSPVPTGTTTPQLVALGTGLDRTKDVSLAQGTKTFPGKIVSSSTGLLVFNLDFSTGTPTQGDGEIVIVTLDGGTTRFPVKI